MIGASTRGSGCVSKPDKHEMKHHKREAWLAARAIATNRTEMAQILSVDIRSVSKLLSYYKVPSFGHSRKYSDEYCKKIADRFLAGETMRLLAHNEGLTEGKIAGILTRAGAFKSADRVIKFVRPAPPRKPREKIIRNLGTRITTSFELAAEPFVPRAADIVPLNISLLDLEWHQCREPYGDGPFTFCGHTAIPGKSFCANHAAINYLPAPVRNRAPRPR